MRRLVLALLLVGCAHTKTTDHARSEAQAAPKTKEVAAPRPVGAEPNSIVRGDGVRKLQRKLGVPESGVIDDKTQNAIARFQRQHALAATGYPDLETAKELGIRADDLFRSGSRDKSSDDAQRQQEKANRRAKR